MTSPSPGFGFDLGKNLDSVLVLVLLRTNPSLGPGFGFDQNQIQILVSDLVLIMNFTQSRIWYRTLKVGTADL